MTPAPLRSIAFNLALIVGSLVISLGLFWALVLPRRYCVPVLATIYGGYISWIEKYILGLNLEIRGLEHLPKDHRYIIAAKHQSAYETLKIPFMARFNYPVIILKKELIFLPFWGLYPLRMGQIPINRSQGASAMKQISAGCSAALASGRSIAIFPQGTRVAPGASAEYKPGLAKIYRDLQVPIIPMSLNTGMFWGRNSFFKNRGTVIFEFHAPIPPGIPPLKMMEQLEQTLETGSAKLCSEVLANHAT
jgi:1-acyl-sn-glycerol-3-phosphate acyltransferase